MDWANIAANGGPTGVVILGLIAILRGYLVPRSQVNALVDLYKERDNDLKEANRIIDARNDELARQISILVPLAETSVKALEAIRTNTKDRETAA